MARKLMAAICIMPLVCAAAAAGPYSGPFNDSSNLYDAPMPGFVGPDGDGRAPYYDELDECYYNQDNYLNPVFGAWASGWVDYLPTDTAWYGLSDWTDPTKGLGPVTGDHFDVVSLGDLNSTQIAAGQQPGRITLTFDLPICNGAGADFAVFENGVHYSGTRIFGELAYVEVSSDGLNFARFGGTSLTASPVGTYSTLDATDVYNLAGKHVNAGYNSWGTPFDLGSIVNDPLVTAGLVDLRQVRYVRLIDIPGSGHYLDSAGRPIYDAWYTDGSGGFDLEALGVISVLVAGDMNADATLTSADIDALHAAIREGSADVFFDLNGDLAIDRADVNELIFSIFATNYGDTNLDGIVDDFDILNIQAAGKYEKGLAATWAQGDFNGDGVCDFDDMYLMMVSGAYTGTIMASIPEPACLLITLVGGCLMLRPGRLLRRGG